MHRQGMLTGAAIGIYRELLRHPDLTADQVGAHLDLDAATTHAALAELAEWSLLRDSAAPGRPTPVRPELGLSILSGHQRRLDSARSAISALADELAGGTGHSDVRRIDGRDAVREHAECLVTRAHGEVALSVPSRDAALLDDRTVPAVVSIRVLYGETGDLEPAAPGALGGSAQARTTGRPPAAMLVCEEAAAVVATGPGTALLIRDAALVGLLSMLFDLCWSSAAPAGSRDDLTDQERRVLTLLAHGATDEAAGMRLGVSARSVRRTMATLMDRLGARSRFQAGRLATRTGWL